MSLHEEVMNLLKAEGYPVDNEVIQDAVADFVTAVEEEMESHDQDGDIDDED